MKYFARELNETFESETEALLCVSAGKWTESDTGTYTCKICGEEFDNDGDLVLHIGWDHGYVEEVPETEEEKERCERIKTIRADPTLSEDEKFAKFCETIMNKNEGNEENGVILR